MTDSGFEPIGFIGDETSSEDAGSAGGGSLAGTTVQMGAASGLVFDITYDSSVANAPAGFTAAIADAVSYYESVFTDPVTIDIDVGWGEIDGQALASNALGESETNVGTVSYSQLVAALQSDAKTSTDAAAVASLPSTNPTGSDNLIISTAEAKALGFSSTGIDGYIGFSSGVAYTFDPNNRAVAGEYDLIGIAEHEITEVMGRIALLGESIGSLTDTYSALDLFRYGSPGVRQLTPGQPAYFSVDGGNTDLDNFNTNLNGDLGDWASSAGNDSYDAFGSSGVAELVSASDLKVMDALGWDATAMVSGTVSPDGSTLTPGQGGDLVTSAGTWTFGTDNEAYGTNILLNGSSAAGGYCSKLEVDSGGNLYANEGTDWWEWNGSGWTATGDPNGSATLSPDGTTLTPGQGGDLVTSAGTWTFGTTSNAYGTGILLNGQMPPIGYGSEIEVADGGNLYADNTGGWWEWNGSGWNATGDPNPVLPSAVTTPAFLTVAEDAAATPLGIVAPTDPNYAAAQLSVTVTALPDDGTVTLDGTTPLSLGQNLTVAQLTGLEFAPAAGAYSQTAPFAYTVTDPGGASAEGTATLTIGAAAGGQVLTVGPGQEYGTLADAVAASQNGDTIEVQAGTYVNDFAQINDNITIEGVGGMAVFEATESIPNGKAILVTDGNVTIDNLAFTGATVGDSNGAGIRYESGDLVLNDDYFYGNQEGLLAAGNPTGNLTINNSEFADNGDGSGYTHNIYIGGDINSLTINDSYFHEAVVGHEIKSRAANTYIYNSRIFDLSGSASYSVDLPNGGNAILENNVIQQGPNSQNPTIIAYGEEGVAYGNNNLQLTGNTLINDLTSHTPLGVWNTTGATAQLDNTQIYGLTPAQVATGPNTQANDVFLSTEPSLDTSHPWLAMS